MCKVLIKLKYFRILNKLSKADLAKKSGVKPATLSRIEAGKCSDSTMGIAFSLASALGVGIDELYIYQEGDLTLTINECEKIMGVTGLNIPIDTARMENNVSYNDFMNIFRQ